MFNCTLCFQILSIRKLIHIKNFLLYNNYFSKTINIFLAFPPSNESNHERILNFKLFKRINQVTVHIFPLWSSYCDNFDSIYKKKPLWYMHANKLMKNANKKELCCLINLFYLNKIAKKIEISRPFSLFERNYEFNSFGISLWSEKIVKNIKNW